MEGRVDLSALERSRMLSQLSSGALGHLRGSSSFSEAESMSQMASDSDRSRGVSPSALHFLPSAGLHPSGSSYAMMAGYLTGHVPDSLKHLLPDMQQYWSAAAHSEGYTRYLLENMYGSYLPYMPATESLAMFAHNSAQLEATLQAQAVQHRIYDLQKEALAGQGMFSHSLYPYPQLYPPPSGQIEATNLSLPSSSRTKKEEEGRREDKRDRETRTRADSVERKEAKASDQCLDFSKHTESYCDRKKTKYSKTDDLDKIKGSSKLNQSSVEATSGHAETEKEINGKAVSLLSDRKRHFSDNSVRRELYQSSKSDSASHVKPALHSPPQRHKMVSSPDRLSNSSRTSERKETVRSPYTSSNSKMAIEQDMPENLCIKDRQKEQSSHKDVKAEVKRESSVVRTQTVETATTVTVTGTLNIITSDIGLKDKSFKRKASSVSPKSQRSPSLSHTSTTTTYSLPYYHNLYSLTQPPDNKRVHATTYVPEIGTVSSPVVGAPGVIQVRESKSAITSDCKTDKKSTVRNELADINNKDAIDETCSKEKEKCKSKKGVKDSDNLSKHVKNSGFMDQDSEEKSEEISENNLDKKGHGVKDRTSNSSQEKDTISKSKKGSKANSSIKQNSSFQCQSDIVHSRKSNKEHSDSDGSEKETKCSRDKDKEAKITKSKTSDIDKTDTSGSNKDKSASGKLKDVPSTVLDTSDVITVSDNEDRDQENGKRSDDEKSKREDEHISKSAPTLKQTTLVKPISVSKPYSENESKAIMDKGKHSDTRSSDRETQLQGIPIGIAVARQRTIAPKVTSDKDNLKKPSDETPKTKNPVADVKPIRPLKVIRPSTKGANSSPKVEKRNELPANLIVTGGTPPSNVFWSEDQSVNRHLASQFHAVPPTSWFGQNAFPMGSTITTNSTGNTGAAGSQLPVNVSAQTGYKLAQDPLTGQLILLPSGPDLFDSTRMFSGLPMANTVNGSPFGPATFVTGGSSVTPSSIVTQTPLFPGHSNVMSDRPANIDINMQPFMPIFGSNILPSTEINIKGEKISNVSVSDSSTTNGAETNSHSTSTHSDDGKDKSMTGTPQTVIRTDGSVAPGCDMSSFTFSAPTVPVVFNPTIIPPQPHAITDHTAIPDDHTAGSEVATVQSRGTSPMLPASDSCPEDLKSDDNAEDVVDICDEDVKHQHQLKDETHEEVHSDHHVNATTENGPYKAELVSEHVSMSSENSIASCQRQNIVDTTARKIDSENISEQTESNHSPLTKSHKANRNIFKDLTDYNPFNDPQVLQAADGLELLSTLAEKSAPVISSEPLVEAEVKIKEKMTCEKLPTNELKTVPSATPTNELKETQGKVDVVAKDEVVAKKKSRIKCGYSFKTKIETKPVVVDEKKMTTFCGITIPEDDDVIDSIEMEMKMRLAELQKRYKEKQKQLAKLTPKKVKDSEKETEKQKSAGDTQRGPGRPKKRSREPSLTENGSSSKSFKVKKTELVNRLGPTGSGSSTGSANHHGHPPKKKNIAEMIVDRVFRKTGSSFKIPLSKKVNLIAPARIEFPGGASVQEKARHKKSLDFKKLIKRSRLSQINGKEGGFVGGFWNKKYSERKHHFNSESKAAKKQKKASDLAPQEPAKSTDSGLGLLAEYAEMSREDAAKKKRKPEEALLNLSPDSPNKKRKPGRPKKCDVVQPGVTETIVAKQSKHIDFFRWQTEEPKQERKISLEGKTPLKPLYLDEWNVRRSERIFLSDPSPQTSPNTISPAPKTKLASPGSKTMSPAAKTKSSTSSDKPKHMSPKTDKVKTEKVKKSQSLNLSMKVKKKYSSGLSQQQKAKEKTTQLLKATRDRLTQSRLEKKNKQTMPVIKVDDVDNSSDSDDMPLSCLIKAKSTDLPDCALHQDKLEDGMRILVFMDGLFHEGELKAIRPPDIYGAVLDNERKTRPHIYPLEEILKAAIKDTKPTCAQQLKEGTRICAYWSQQFSCLYPGTISKANPDDEDEVDKDLFNVDFDDTDTGKIPLDHIRIIPQDFPHVEYDPNPLLLLTKRRRTLSISESSEPRKSQSDPPQKKSQPDTGKEPKIKRGPGRPPKTDRLISVESMGDEDVFSNETSKTEGGKKSKQTGDQDKKSDANVAFVQPRELWQWSGSCTKRPGMKGKARKEFYKTIVRHKEHISVGDCAVFISTGRPNLPYVGRIESFYETWSGQMVVKVKWFYHPEETKGGKRLQKMKGALFRSDHEDENDVQTISHKCEVIPYSEYRRRIDVISHENNDDVYYLAGAYEPTIGHIKFEPGVL